MKKIAITTLCIVLTAISMCVSAAEPSGMTVIPKVGMAYLCRTRDYEEITRIFTQDGTFFEQWNKKQKQSRADVVYVGRWLSGADGRVLLNDVTAVVAGRFSQAKRSPEE